MKYSKQVKEIKLKKEKNEKLIIIKKSDQTMIWWKQLKFKLEINLSNN
jgi:hypothetical protein